jgi:hypothetical protein
MAVNALGLDPEDPLIPMPWQMDSIRAYRAGNAAKAEENALKMERLRQDVEKGRQDAEKASEETPVGRANKAADIAAFLEQQQQKKSGIPISEEMGAKMTSQGGPSILEASKMQGELDVESKMRQAKIDSAKNYLAGGKSLMPTANVDLGGVSRTVLASEAGETMADTWSQIYKSMTPTLGKTLEAEGYDRDTAIRMSSQEARAKLSGAAMSGKIPLVGANGIPIIVSTSEAIKMFADSNTPQFLKNQLDKHFGEKQEPQAASWIKTRLGR